MASRVRTARGYARATIRPGNGRKDQARGLRTGLDSGRYGVTPATRRRGKGAADTRQHRVSREDVRNFARALGRYYYEKVLCFVQMIVQKSILHRQVSYIYW